MLSALELNTGERRNSLPKRPVLVDELGVVMRPRWGTPPWGALPVGVVETGCFGNTCGPAIGVLLLYRTLRNDDIDVEMAMGRIR